MQSLKPVPVRPSYPTPSARYVARACFASIKAALGGPYGRNPVAVARALYPDDEIPALLLERSAVAGAHTDVPGWAAELAAVATSTFLAGLGPASAISEVIKRGLVVPIGDRVEVKVPSRSPQPAGGWIGEAEPLPIVAMPISSAVLVPKKAGVGLVLSRELAMLTGAESVFNVMLRESAGATLDSLALSTAAATADGLAGLLNGVVPLASSGSALADLEQLAAAVGGVDGSSEVVFVASVGVAAGLAVRNDIKAGTTILGSVACPPSRLIAIDPLGLIFGVNPVPDIAADAESVIHMSDTPSQLGMPGAPATVAAPSASMYQTAQIAMRMLIDLCWAKRRPAAVQFVDALNWS